MIELCLNTDLFIVCQCDSQYLTNNGFWASMGKWLSTISFGEVLTIVCTVVGFIIAIKQYKTSSNNSREQAQRNQRESWFLQVIVLPQLSDINKFYSDLLALAAKDKGIVESLCSLCHNEFTLEMAKLQEDSKDAINQFFDHISALVKSYNPELGQQVDDIVMELEDCYVNILNAYARKEEVRVREKILENKQKLISVLNSGMSK